MGSSQSSYAAASLPVKKRPKKNYVELRHPNGSIVHLLGVDSLSEDCEVSGLIRTAVPESVLLELCDERVLFIWELLEQGKQRNGKWQRPLPALNLNAFRSDARLRSLHFWLFGGLELEAAASLLDTTVGGSQALVAAEATSVGAQTYPVDRREFVTIQRILIGCLECVPPLVRNGQFTEAWSGLNALVDEVLAPARKAIFSLHKDQSHQFSELQAKSRHGLDQFFKKETTLKPPATSNPLIDTVRAVILDERDQIFAHKYWECATQLGTGGIAVAVVAKHHLPGIQRHWSKTEPNTIKSILAARDAPAVITATAPIFLATGITFASTSFLPKTPRRLIFYTALTAPFFGIGFVAQRKTAFYNSLRSFQLANNHPEMT